VTGVDELLISKKTSYTNSAFNTANSTAV